MSSISADNQGYSELNQTEPTDYDPSPEEKKAIKLSDRMYSKAKKARKPYDENWLNYYKMFRGKQWKENRPTYRHSEVINLIFRAIQSMVPILTDGRPMPSFIPQEPQDLELAEVLNEVLESDWNAGNWLYVLTEAIYDSHFYGAGFGSLKYDPEANYNQGAIVFRSEDCFYTFPDPASRDVNKESNYFVFAEPRDIETLKRENPDKAQYIKPDLIDVARRDKSHVQDQVRYISPTDMRMGMDGVSNFDNDSRDEALEVSLYIHDPEVLEEEKKEIGDDGMEKSIYIQRMRYPNGRMIKTVSGVLIEDCPIPYEDNKFPYLKLINYILPREFWGISEIEQLESPQKIFNKLVCFSLDVLTLMGNPIWVVDSDSDVDTDNLFNRPGMVVEKAKGSEVRREEGVQLQPYVLQLIDRLKGYFDDISGSTDASRGVKPEGVTAASAITALQESSQTRLRQKTRHIDAFMQDFGQMYISRVFQYYDSPRVFRVTNNQNVQKYFKFHVEKRQVVDEQGQATGEETKFAKVRDYNQGEDGQHYLGEEREYQIRGKFDVMVSSGSSLPFEKDRIEQQSYALFDRQIIDAEEVLKNIKYPNAEAVMQRMMDKQMQAQEQEAMAAQAPPQA